MVVMMIVAKKAYTVAPSSTCQLEWRHDARTQGLTRSCGLMATQMVCVSGGGGVMRQRCGGRRSTNASLAVAWTKRSKASP